MKFRCLLVVLALFAHAAAATELTPHRAEYKVRIAVVSGQLNTELRATDDGYVATHVVKPTGLARVIASGEMLATVCGSSFHTSETST